LFILTAKEDAMEDILVLRRRVRALVLFFMAALTASGLTAVPLAWELGLLNRLAGPGSALAGWLPVLGGWIGRVHVGLQAAYVAFPQISYGTDWLAFAHLVIALAFIGLLHDPVRNRWVVEWGMLACGLLLPWTLLMGAVRGIPWFWQLVDMSFGLVGMLPLWFTRRSILRLAVLTSFESRRQGPASRASE
jgi:hypothetical protein